MVQNYAYLVYKFIRYLRVDTIFELDFFHSADTMKRAVDVRQSSSPESSKFMDDCDFKVLRPNFKQ